MADANVKNIGDTYMFGPSFLVAPVYEYGARAREVYFPKCAGWYDFYGNEFVEGGSAQTLRSPSMRTRM